MPTQEVPAGPSGESPKSTIPIRLRRRFALTERILLVIHESYGPVGFRGSAEIDEVLDALNAAKALSGDCFSNNGSASGNPRYFGGSGRPRR
jgi:hypothetical protein